MEAIVLCEKGVAQNGRRRDYIFLTFIYFTSLRGQDLYKLLTSGGGTINKVPTAE